MGVEFAVGMVMKYNKKKGQIARSNTVVKWRKRGPLTKVKKGEAMPCKLSLDGDSSYGIRKRVRREGLVIV